MTTEELREALFAAPKNGYACRSKDYCKGCCCSE